MVKVRNQQRNLAVTFYDYEKAYDMVRHDWITRVYQSMGVPEKVINVIVKLIEGWKTRLEVTEDGKVLTSRKSNIRYEFLQRGSYSLVGFYLTELPISVLIVETDGYTMGRRDEERVKRTDSLFIGDLKIYQVSHRKLEVVNEIVVKASVDTAACYRVKKCAEIIFRKNKTAASGATGAV